MMAMLKALAGKAGSVVAPYLMYVKVACVALIIAAMAYMYYQWQEVEAKYLELNGKYVKLEADYARAKLDIENMRANIANTNQFYADSLDDFQENRADLERRLGVLNGQYGSCKQTLTIALDTISSISREPSQPDAEISDDERAYIESYLGTLVPARVAELLLVVQERRDALRSENEATDSGEAEAARDHLGRLTTRSLIDYTLRLEAVVMDMADMIDNYMEWRDKEFPEDSE